MRQRSRVLWVTSGDKNSKFFCNYIRSRQSKNTIRCLTNGGGDKGDTHDAMSKIAVDHFSKFLRGSSEIVEDDMHDFIHSKLSDDQIDMLSSLVASWEIYDALFCMPDEKAPGPDCYTAFFFQKCSGIIGEDVVDAVMYFFNSGRM
ncbi:hypothetical protein LINPERPRIM_LOCUS20227 [Linum perenne]